MAPAYTITTRPGSNLLLLILTGLFGPAEVESFRRDRDAALLALTCPPHSHFTLCDVSGCPIQTQESAQVFARMISEPPRRSRLLAFVTGDSLARMQVRRLTAGRDEIAIYERRADALAWLAAGGADLKAIVRAAQAA